MQNEIVNPMEDAQRYMAQLDQLEEFARVLSERIENFKTLYLEDEAEVGVAAGLDNHALVSDDELDQLIAESVNVTDGLSREDQLRTSYDGIQESASDVMQLVDDIDIDAIINSIDSVEAGQGFEL